MAFTYFFRDLPPLEQAVRHVIPAVAGRTKIRIWDAGSAMGQEPYTVAILLAEAMNQFAFRNLRIYTTDIDENFGQIIKDGIYPEAEVQRIPGDLFEKYFRPNGKAGHFQLDEKIRGVIEHQRHDLLSLEPIGFDFCLIVCKNVLLHFQQAQRIEVFRMFHAALSPGGFIVTEHTQKMPQEVSHLFEQVVPDAQLFRKVEAAI